MCPCCRPAIIRSGYRCPLPLGERLRRAPVLPEPGQRGGIVGAQAQHRSRHRNQGMEVERAGPAGADAGDGHRMPAWHRRDQPVGDDAGAFEAETARRRVENPFFLLLPLKIQSALVSVLFLNPWRVLPLARHLRSTPWRRRATASCAGRFHCVGFHAAKPPPSVSSSWRQSRIILVTFS
jgi:hypothetical protein